MRITVRLGEPFWRQIDSKEVTLHLPEGATVGDMLVELEERYPILKEYLSESEIPPTVVIEEELASPETPLNEEAKPTLVWAIAGG